MIKTTTLGKIFTTDELETAALSNINVTIQKGEFVAIMGPSGCGKSTLLNILGLLDKPTSGQYLFADTEVSHLTESKRAKFRKGTVGFIFQSFNLIDDLTVYENVELPLLYLKVSASARKNKVEAILKRMDIMHRRKHYPQQLSGGQQQRVAIARAVVSNPSVIFADEPTGNLDSKNGDQVMNILSALNKEGATIIMVTHSPYDANYAHRVIRLLDGSIISENIREKFHV